MKRLHLEIIDGLILVLGGSFLAYHFLRNVHGFWTAQNVWSLLLGVGWLVVAGGYWHQGTIIHHAHSASHVSLLLPCTVFVVQCVLFVKGIYYHDVALVFGALLVNSAVVFDIYQILKFRK